MTKKESGDILKWFKKNVGLSDWVIDINNTIPPPERNWVGAQVSDLCRETATIWIVPELHKGQPGIIADEEHTLFHELIHCFYEDCDIDSSGDRVELCINRFASVLLKQYRSDCG